MKSQDGESQTMSQLAKSMPRNFMLVLATFWLMFSGIVDSHAQTSTPPTLRTAFMSAICKRACWEGIEPGVATLVTLKQHWRLNNSLPDVESGVGKPDINNAVLTWLVSDYPLAPTEITPLPITATTWKGIVIQLIVPVEICVSQIITEIGMPSQIGLSYDTYYLMYEQSGLVFQIALNSSPHQLVLVFLVSEMSFPSWRGASDLSFVRWRDAVSYLARQCNSDETF